MEEVSNLLRVCAGTTTLIISLSGLIINIYVFFSLFKMVNHNFGFYKICLTKTISNSVTCLAFLVWSTPCTFLNNYYLPHFGNMIWGQIAGWGAYIAGMLLQLAISLNRLCVSYFPLETSRSHSVLNMTNCLGLIVLISIGYTSIGLRSGCSYIYDISSISWTPEPSSCARKLASFMFYSIVTLSFISNTSNVATFIKLFKIFKDDGGGLVESQRSKKTRKSRIMFAQSVTQDCLHLVDMFSCQILYKVNSSLWFQFICMSVVWLSIHVLDGFVMLIYNKEIQPRFMRRVLGNCSQYGSSGNKNVFSMRSSQAKL